MDDTAYWLALQRVPGIGTATFHKLVDQFGSPRNVFESGFFETGAYKQKLDANAETHFLKDSLLKNALLKKNTLAQLKNPDWRFVEKELQWSNEANNHILTLLDPNYPPLLKQIADPPPILYVKGDPGLLKLTQIAIVGSRNPSHSGKESAYEFAYTLANSGLIITSGLAMGIDGESHKGALSANSPTIAVSGTGLDKVYPARHHALAVRISDVGALVSEYALGTPPIAANFPKRNRIISGLSVGTVVVEATLKSGSLITARMAADQGREVFAIPGSIKNPASKGCHKLIREGAKLVETTEDILEELAPLCQFNLSKRQGHVSSEKNTRLDANSDTRLEPQLEPELEPEQSEFLYKVGYDPVSIDGIVQRTGMSVESISSLLMVLELRGKITSSNGFYIRSDKL
ncbi:MAG: DNA-protecting protein DprA [Gammaproteobacteria bacterium]|nr:DNA-protecting protein DprA [Gammaproteobacteria bacterium]